MAATNSKKEETLKDPPKNLEAERNLLGALMRDGTLLAAIGNEIGPLNPDDFASEKNRIIYSCILNRASSSDEFDPTVICSILENEGLLDKVGGKAYISGLIANTAPESIANNTILLRWCRRSNLKWLLRNAHTNVQSVRNSHRLRFLLTGQ